MKLTNIKTEPITRAEQISLSDHFVICCTRGSITILQRDTLQVLKKITQVTHVLKAVVSPNEKWALILATNDAFYILSLESYNIKKYNIMGRSPCGCCIDGHWTFDGKSFFIPVYNGTTTISSLRRYSFNETQDNNLPYTDILNDKYYYRTVVPIHSMNKYLILAIDRCKQDHRISNYYTLIVFDGELFEEYPLPDFDHNLSPSHIEYNDNTHIVTLRGILGLSVSFQYKNGKFCHVENNSFTGFKNNIDNQEIITNILKAAGCKHNEVNEIIRSSNRYRYYVSSNKGLIVVDKETYSIVSRIRFKHGIEKTVEFGSRYIGVATLDGLRMYEILEE